jgi:ribosomal-protein-alanine N-acetyltransferase
MNRPKFPVTQTERLVLDNLNNDDQTAIYEIFSDLKVMEFFDMEPFTKKEEGLGMISFFRNKFLSKSGIRWAIREKGSSKLIGTCGFNSWVEFDHSAIIGYELATPYWGKGYASEAIAHIIKLAYQGGLPITVNRIEASVVPGNIGSENVLKKNGFQLEGCLREKGFWANQYHDMNLFSLIKKDYL